MRDRTFIAKSLLILFYLWREGSGKSSAGISRLSGLRCSPDIRVINRKKGTHAGCPTAGRGGRRWPVYHCHPLSERGWLLYCRRSHTSAWYFKPFEWPESGPTLRAMHLKKCNAAALIHLTATWKPFVWFAHNWPPGTPCHMQIHDVSQLAPGVTPK